MEFTFVQTPADAPRDTSDLIRPAEERICNQQIVPPVVKGRFAPSPSGRMHLGNVYTALLSWLSARSQNGTWLLRIEDLDPQRSKYEYARLIEDDLAWLGLDWDEGGIDGRGPNGPYLQSRRHDCYQAQLARLQAMGLTYPCYCTRADIMATQAPHQSDGRIVYAGTCRPPHLGAPGDAAPISAQLSRAGAAGTGSAQPLPPAAARPAAIRLWVPDRIIEYHDRNYGPQRANLARECGDFVLRRADGAWAYQLAVVVDDALMGVTEVVRGNDLLLSGIQQTYLYQLLGFRAPEFAHLPLVCNRQGHRLSKRDHTMAMDYLRQHYTPEEVIGQTAAMAGLLPEPMPISAPELLDAMGRAHKFGGGRTQA